MKTKFKVGDHVRLIPRNKLRTKAQKRYLQSRDCVCGIPNAMYEARREKVQRLTRVEDWCEFAGDYPQFSYPHCLLRLVKAAKRKA